MNEKLFVKNGISFPVFSTEEYEKKMKENKKSKMNNCHTPPKFDMKKYLESRGYNTLILPHDVIQKIDERRGDLSREEYVARLVSEDIISQKSNLTI